ncbi:MAG: HDOD domain-containing protein [Bdellovibrionales bacterium]
MGAPKLITQNILQKFEEFPSLPAIVYELSQIINDPMSSTNEVERVMLQDLGMTTKVLKLANSAYYAIPGGVSSLARAIAFIGFDTIHQLVLSSSIIKSLEIKDNAKFSASEFWRHSLGVAIAAETIGKHVNHPSPSDLFTGGLIHDMGKIVLYVVSSESLIYIAEECSKTKKSFLSVEEEIGQIPHTELGKLLAEKWRLPKSMQVASKYHHEKDSKKRGGISNDLSQNVDVLYLANLLIHALKFGNSGHSQIIGASNEVLERLMIDPQKDMGTIVKKIKTALESAEDFIKLITSIP